MVGKGCVVVGGLVMSYKECGANEIFISDKEGIITRVWLGIRLVSPKSWNVSLLFFTIVSTSSLFRWMSSISIMSWNLVAVSSLIICSFGSFLENPRKLNEQIRNDDTVFICL